MLSSATLSESENLVFALPEYEPPDGEFVGNGPSVADGDSETLANTDLEDEIVAAEISVKFFVAEILVSILLG